MQLRLCDRCEMEECLARRLPASGLDSVIANPSTEYCVVGRSGDEVWKLIAWPMNAMKLWQFRVRDVLSVAFPALFAPTAFDEELLVVRQPFIDGRMASGEEVVGAKESVRAAGLPMVVDLAPANVIVTNDGRRVIIDFGLDVAFHDELKARFGVAIEEFSAAEGRKG